MCRFDWESCPGPALDAEGCRYYYPRLYPSGSVIYNEKAYTKGEKGLRYDPKRFDQLVNEFRAKEDAIMNWKGAEYTEGVDRLQNFREIAQFMGMPVSEVALLLMLKHVQGIKKQVLEHSFVWEWETDSGEGLKQRFADVRNYLLLLAAALDEEAENNREPLEGVR